MGGGSPSSTITNAINNAVNNGRNNKGCVVLFSTGNENVGVGYPATLSNVIAVGATSQCDQRKSPTSCDGENFWGSNFGTEIGVVAPGVEIYTTDISGAMGYDGGDYDANFNGTSSACPQVAGVVAFILSVNPNLTQLKVREYLEKNTDKITGYTYSNTSGKPNGTWNSEVGYGRINANKAVQSALPKITGLTTFYPSATFSVSVPSGGSVAWSVSPSNALSFTQGSQSTTFSRVGNFSGAATITATITSTYEPMTLTKTVNVIGNISMTWNGTGPYGQVDVSVSGGSTPYKFYKNGTLIKTSNSSSVTLAFGCDGGLLKAEANTSCGTASVSDIVMSGCASFGAFAMTIYPNPSSSQVFVKRNNEKTSSFNGENSLGIYETLGAMTLELYDFSGNKVKESKYEVSETEKKIDVSRLPKGYYFLRIIGKELDETHQIIVE